MTNIYDLDTPALLVDLDRLERNIAEMTRLVQGVGLDNLAAELDTEERDRDVRLPLLDELKEPTHVLAVLGPLFQIPPLAGRAALLAMVEAVHGVAARHQAVDHASVEIGAGVQPMNDHQHPPWGPVLRPAAVIVESEAACPLEGTFTVPGGFCLLVPALGHYRVNRRLERGGQPLEEQRSRPPVNGNRISDGDRRGRHSRSHRSAS